MKALIPIALLFFGIIMVFFPLVFVELLPPKADINNFAGTAMILTPMVAGLVLVGFGILFAFKTYNEK